VAGAIAATWIATSIYPWRGLMPSKKRVAARKWSAKVHTDSTYPPEGLFKKSAAVIARTLASPEVSSKGPSSGMRILSFYINRAGRNLKPKQRDELQKAKELLHKKVEHDGDSQKKPMRRKKAA
jgi:tRNA(adenine34) deaminase